MNGANSFTKDSQSPFAGKRCPHGILWPHECRECEASLPDPRGFENVESYERAVDEWEKQNAYR